MIGKRTIALAVLSPFVAPSMAFAATGEGDNDWTQPMIILAAGLVLAVGVYRAMRNSRPVRASFLSWEVQRHRKQVARAWRRRRPA